jgi:hypothetical protein
MNIDFVIHRYSEWTMLMLGESILSLLIVDIPNESSDYFTTFYCGLITVILLQFLHFRSQPHEADDHVMRRSKNRGIYWSGFWHVYSASLVALGAVYTLFVLSFSASNDSHRRTTLLLLEAEGTERVLAAGGASPYPPDEMEQRAAHMFSMALATIFLTLDGMSVMHVGFKHGAHRCYCDKQKSYNLKGVFLVLIRFCIVAFVATLSQWITDPEVLSGIGLGITLFQVLLRRLGEMYLPEAMEHLGEQDNGGKWPNTTEARAIPEATPEEED